jgi:hypothetical protein
MEGKRENRNQAFTFFVEFLLPQVIGRKVWMEEMSSKNISKTVISASGEAFALLCLENMWKKWHPKIENMNSGEVENIGWW